MNIAFLLLTLHRGGIENLTCFLANELQKKGHQVSIIAIKPDQDSDLVKTLVCSIRVLFLNGFSASKENVRKLRELFLLQKTQIVINQFGLPYIPCLIVKRASHGLCIKLISAYHSDPMANGRILAVEQQIRNEKSGVKCAILKIKRVIFREITRASMSYVYHQSDAYVLLSPCFRDNFISFTRIKRPENLTFIANPVTIDSSGFEYAQDKKKKQILFVGRMDNTVKRIDRVIDVWARLENDNPDWELLVLGDGPDLMSLKQYANEKGLKRITFKGGQFPAPYYKDASIILLTSEFEGFGLVLVEGMTFGVVPVAYGSYDSVYDIIEDGVNGYIVKPLNGVFSQELMIEAIKKIINDRERTKAMALKSMQIGEKFQKDVIIKQWETLFSRLL